MIKVNLLRNRVEDTSTNVMSASPNTEARDAFVKVLIMLLATVALMVYEHHHIDVVNGELARVDNQVARLQSQATQLAGQVAGNKDVQGVAKELQDKLKLIKLLSKLRLRQIKTLDFVQSSIPERVWLKTVEFESEKNHPDEGEYQFSGNSVTTADLTQFISRLNQSSYLSNVIVIQDKAIQFQSQADAPARDFEFIANVENTD